MEGVEETKAAAATSTPGSKAQVMAEEKKGKALQMDRENVFSLNSRSGANTVSP